jgi:hypothetical protein
LPQVAVAILQAASRKALAARETAGWIEIKCE